MDEEVGDKVKSDCKHFCCNMLKEFVKERKKFSLHVNSKNIYSIHRYSVFPQEFLFSSKVQLVLDPCLRFPYQGSQYELVQQLFQSRVYLSLLVQK